jgi:GAF domain-containing protein
MPLRATTVRFGEDLWALLEREAERQGLSAAQYVRDATVMRLAFAMAEHGDPEAEATLADVASRAARRRPAGNGGASAHRRVLEDPERRDAVKDTGLLDTPADESFERLTRLAAQVLGAPVALVSLVDADRQFFKSCLGLPEPWRSRRETPLSHSFCQHAVVSREPLVISDAREDPRVRDNLAIRDLDAIAYAGIPLITRAGHAVGSLCVIDHRPRIWTRDQIAVLRDVAASVVTELTLRGVTSGGSG